MTKRFTCTDKWKDDWFMELSHLEKLVYLFVLDNCDCAGVWRISNKLLSFHLGERVLITDFLDKFDGKIIQISEKHCLATEFISFQNVTLIGKNGERLNNGVFKKIGNILDTYELFYCEDTRVTKPLGNPYGGVKVGVLEEAGVNLTKLRSITKPPAQEKKACLTESEKVKPSQPKQNRSERQKLYEEIIFYLNAQIGKNYKPSTQSTKKLIDARLNEDFTVEDFKTVIDNQIQIWGLNGDQSKYLRPVTLFGNKFESYLNVIIKKEEVFDPEKYLGPSTTDITPDWMKEGMISES